MNWYRRAAGRYIVSVCLDDELTPDGTCFRFMHFTVERKRFMGSGWLWEATFVFGDAQNVAYSLGAYSTMREAREVSEREVTARNRQAVSA